MNLDWLALSGNELTGPIPTELGSLKNLRWLDLSYNWGLAAGPLPPGLEQSSLEELDIFVTRACAPAAWQEWLATIEFYGPPCDAEGDVTIDVAVVYTPSAVEAAGSAAAIEAAIDLMIAETNEAYARAGWTSAWRWWAGPKCRIPRRAASSTSAVSRIRRTATSTRCTICATGSGRTSCT